MKKMITNFYSHSNNKFINMRMMFIACILTSIISLCMLSVSSCKGKKSTIKPNNLDTVFYLVTFNSNGGTNVNSVKVKSGTKVTKPIDPTRTNYIFGGWYTDQTFKQVFDFNTAITQNIMLYAKWNIAPGKTGYNVTFNSNGGSDIAVQVVVSGDTAVKPIDPTRLDYMFGGWYSDQELTKKYDFHTPVIMNITLYAQWLLQYKVTFNSNGGSAVPTQLVLSGGLATKPTDPTRTGYTFNGWYQDQAFTQAFDFNTTTIKSDITLYAKWVVKTYSISFNTNGGSPIAGVTVAYGSKLSKPTDPTRTGYTLEGWYKDQALTQVFDFNSTITGDMILYAKWAINKDLLGIITSGTIPTDLSSYDIVSRSVLMNYTAGANVVAVYVTKNGTGDGSSWTNAKNTVTNALDGITDASDNKVYIVLVGAGVYQAGASMKMKNNVAIIGGWPASGGWARSANDITELNGNNSYKVFDNSFKNGEPLINTTALLYGVTIANGNGGTIGGGMLNYIASPTIINVVFSGNTADNGGGMYNQYASPILTNVTFSGNSATKVDGDRGTGAGGGMFNLFSSPVITNATFLNNKAILTGAGLFSQFSSPVITNVTFSGNTSYTGPAVSIQVPEVNNQPEPDPPTTPIITNDIFWGNTGTGPDASNKLQIVNSKVSSYYSVSPDEGTSNGNTNTDPSLTAFQSSEGVGVFQFTGQSPVNIGLYVKRSKKSTGTTSSTNITGGNFPRDVYTFYYSSDGSTWYTNHALTGTPIAPPSDAINLTATDATGYPRSGRPDAGAWERR